MQLNRPGLASVEPTVHLPLAAVRPGRASASPPAWDPRQDASETTIAPPRSVAPRSLLFLVQYIAQEVLGEGDETPSRWGIRDSAYRTAAASDAAPTTGLRIDA